MKLYHSPKDSYAGSYTYTYIHSLSFIADIMEEIMRLLIEGRHIHFWPGSSHVRLLSAAETLKILYIG
jgi:hypothetical protein